LPKGGEAISLCFLHAAERKTTHRYVTHNVKMYRSAIGTPFIHHTNTKVVFGLLPAKAKFQGKGVISVSKEELLPFL